MITHHLWHRIALRDRLWAGASVVTSVGPLPVPPRADLVRALRRLADHSDLTRVGWTVTGGVTGWGAASDLDAYCDLAVQELPPVAGEDPGGTAERVYALGRRGLPVSIVTCGDSIAMNVAHVMADGYHMGRLLHAVIETAYSGELPPWATRPTEDRPLRRALWNFFGRHPERVVALRALLNAPEADVTAAPADPATQVTRGTSPWRPSAACVMRTSTPAALGELKRWRKANAPGVSSAALTFAVAERARAELGHASATPPLVLFDARRYLARRDREVAGNFCAGLYLDVAEPFHPQAFHDRMGSAAELGRPLTALSVGLLRTRLRPAHDTPEPVGPVWNTAHTYLGRPPDIARLPWLDDGRLPYYIGMLTPAGPNGITLGYTEIGHRINVTASFNDNVIDRAEVAAMLELMCTDPARLLHTSAGSRSADYVSSDRAATPSSAPDALARAS
jgi:hypothetical protein